METVPLSAEDKAKILERQREAAAATLNQGDGQGDGRPRSACGVAFKR